MSCIVLVNLIDPFIKGQIKLGTFTVLRVIIVLVTLLKACSSIFGVFSLPDGTGSFKPLVSVADCTKVCHKGYYMASQCSVEADAVCRGNSERRLQLIVIFFSILTILTNLSIQTFAHFFVFYL